ncbi:hypothetical protein V6N13_043870 [Hibiscus sabdariffa]|uniref:Uncharacterized protein n=1 Tax=Hibiscus sabdariffa TaxID=183260 RepID=A0ABR2RGL8_9ROSI
MRDFGEEMEDWLYRGFGLVWLFKGGYRGSDGKGGGLKAYKSLGIGDEMVEWLVVAMKEMRTVLMEMVRKMLYR